MRSLNQGLVMCYDTDVLIKSDSKIAQMIFLKCQYPEIQIGSVDNDTERGEGRFGSTGNN